MAPCSHSTAKDRASGLKLVKNCSFSDAVDLVGVRRALEVELICHLNAAGARARELIGQDLGVVEHDVARNVIEADARWGKCRHGHRSTATDVRVGRSQQPSFRLVILTETQKARDVSPGEGTWAWSLRNTRA